MKRLAREEGIFAGVSSGGAIAAALKLSAEVEEATIVAIICDRGTGIYRPVFSSRWMDGGAGSSGSTCSTRLNPVLGEVLKIHDR